MWPYILIVSGIAMVAIWIVAGVCSSRGARAVKTAIFLLGTFIVWPVFAFAFFVSLAEVTFTGIDKPVGDAMAIILVLALCSFVIWLAGYWFASIIGWAAR